MNGFVIAGTNSGCGKTTITMGLMSLLASRGLRVAPFKAGPDYIDPIFHSLACNSTPYNLDSYLLNTSSIQHLFQKHCKAKDIAVIEGVMGLFDGLGPDSEGSTAQLAKSLDLPVILVVSCKSSYQSVAATVLGFTMLDPELRIGGIILNHVGNAEQYQFLKQYIEDKTAIPCLGYLPNSAGIKLESRHLGLVQAEEDKALVEKISAISEVMRHTIDINKLLSLKQLHKPNNQGQPVELSFKRDLSKLRLAVANDKAFRFYYRDNLDLLLENGATIMYFSPLNDSKLPRACNALYIGGGYPEVFADQLSANKSLMAEIKAFAQNGMPIYAECGGLMYLTQAIETLNDERIEMCGVFDCSSQMTHRLQRFGYCELAWDQVQTRAHEFHHSKLIFSEHQTSDYQFDINKPIKNRNWQCGLRYQNVVAGYPHIHFYSSASFYHKIIDLWTQQTIPS